MYNFSFLINFFETGLPSSWQTRSLCNKGVDLSYIIERKGQKKFVANFAALLQKELLQ